MIREHVYFIQVLFSERRKPPNIVSICGLLVIKRIIKEHSRRTLIPFMLHETVELLNSTCFNSRQAINIKIFLTRTIGNILQSLMLINVRIDTDIA